MTVQEKLSALRQQMARRGMQAYIVVTDDFHGSEYVGDYFKARAYLSGFTGSAGTLVVLPQEAALWTDGRYYLQAQAQLEGSGITLMRSGMPKVPTIGAFLAQKLEEGSCIGFDGRTVSNALAQRITEKVAPKGITFSCQEDLVDALWPHRPALPAQPVWALDPALAGQSRREKLAQVRQAMKAQTLVLTALDEIAWLLNLRGNDIAYTPLFLSYAILTPTTARLFVQPGVISQEREAELADDGVSLAPYDAIYAQLSALPQGQSVQLDSATANYRVVHSLPQDVPVIDEESPIAAMKAVKTPAEQANMRTAHIKDGVAVTRFIRWLKQTIGKQTITELSAAEKLRQFRGQMDGFLGESFDAILAYGPHGAIVHYEPTEETDLPMAPKGFCLADTGGHYREGTTDITRTIALGELTAKEKRAYTLVLQGHLRLGAARFPHGACGANLDVLARQPLWEQGLDYRHGTGHGVGFLLNIHEGPQSLQWKPSGGALVVLEPGMVLSNEPGYYEPGEFGIRHENLVLVQPGETTEYGQFLYLEPLTMVPFDRQAIDPTLLSPQELALLNAYHQQVYAALSPWLKTEERLWLQEQTAPILP